MGNRIEAEKAPLFRTNTDWAIYPAKGTYGKTNKHGVFPTTWHNTRHKSAVRCCYYSDAVVSSASAAKQASWRGTLRHKLRSGRDKSKAAITRVLRQPLTFVTKIASPFLLLRTPLILRSEKCSQKKQMSKRDKKEKLQEQLAVL